MLALALQAQMTLLGRHPRKLLVVAYTTERLPAVVDSVSRVHRFLLANCCITLGKHAEAERVLLEGTGVLHKGPKEGRDEILADPCPIPHGAAGLRLLGK